MRPSPEPAIGRLRAQIGFGAGGVAIGALTTGLNSFLLIYYSQVLGLAPSLAGLALALALVVDAVSDPLVGLWSDRTRSRIGRRHPFLWASVLPMGLSFWLLWFPPLGSENQLGLFAYLLGVTMALRLSMTLFDVPANALIPELSRDYDLRTRFSAAKTSLSWMSANAIGIAMYAFWLGDEGGPAGSGLLRQSGYQSGAVFVALLVMAAALTLLLVIRPRDVPAQDAAGAGPAALHVGVLRSLVQIYRRRSVLALLGSAMLFSAASGTALALWIYLYAYFWGLGSQAIILVQVMYLLAALLSLLLLPRLAARRDKRQLALWLSGIFWLNDALPIGLRLLDLMPANGSVQLTTLLCAHALLNGVLYNMVVTMVLSMLSDVVEESQLETGRREEAAVLAGQTFVSKTSTALGTLFGGLLLAWIAFPSAAAPGAVPADVLARLGATYVPLMWGLGALSTWLIARYALTREKREQVVAALAAKAG
jgi:glycoside/pentoside/hexuronide:cation symporter, GPH family